MLKDHYNHIYTDNLDIEAIIATVQPELDGLAAELRALFDDAFPMTATPTGIVKWEALLGIVADPATENLEERRFRVRARLGEQIPFTLRALQQQLASLCGSDGYAVDMQYDRYLLDVSVYFDDRGRLNSIWDMLARIVPANIIYRLISQITAPPLTAPIHVGGAITASFFTTTLPPLSREEGEQIA